MNTGFLGPAVATVLTVYGIETKFREDLKLYAIYIVATVLTVYGIETRSNHSIELDCNTVATVLTVYGIETFPHKIFNTKNFSCNSTYRLRY